MAGIYKISSLYKSLLDGASSLILPTPENSKRITVSCECVISLAASQDTVFAIKLKPCTLNRRHVRLHERVVFLRDVL